MNLIILSDFHVKGPEDPIYFSLLSIIRQLKTNDIMVLAGDVFDLFVGSDRIFLDRYVGFFEAIRQAAEAGAQFHYIEGNHDFLFRKAFRGIPHFTIHSSEVQLAHGGHRFYVAHGDLVDRNDYGYRFLRLLFRSIWMKFFLWLVPGRWVDAIGKKSSETSRNQKPTHADLMHDDRVDYLRKTFRQFSLEKMRQGYDYVILGHCHDLDDAKFQWEGGRGEYFNMGYPPVHGYYLRYDSDADQLGRVPLPSVE